ncbi:hypothetical protein KIW84_042010 [Lathyrus oleraceus]|uniref:EH domain-containing protein n=1 Tax=Pisum sativum TaxID=3888 RepID=A0A9D4XBF6_PEA|nr:hypothetical protein KIW84_042010 [Pisum sativum]
MATVADIGYSAAINLTSAIIFLLAFAILRLQPFPPVASKPAKKLPLNAVTSIIDGLKKLYVERLKPLEATDRFNDFVSPLLTNSNFDAKLMVMLLGQYSTGKTSIALHFSPFVESYQTVTRSTKSLRNSFNGETAKIPTTEETIKKRKKSPILFSEAALLIEIPPKFL